MSSHPGALMAVLRALGPGLEALDLSFIRTHAQNVLAACPVEYVSSAKLRGAVFTDREGATQEDRIQDEGKRRGLYVSQTLGSGSTTPSLWLC
jgi:hypothetical protein